MKTKRFIKMLTLIISVISLICIKLISAGLYNLQGDLVTNYPNPFDSRCEATSIVYNISNEAEVRMVIYDLFGNMVREYSLGKVTPGTNTISWDGTNEYGRKVAKGGYICVIEILTSSNSRILTTRKIGVIH